MNILDDRQNIKGPCVFKFLFKGAVSRDFSSPVFFIKQLLPVPIGMPKNNFVFLKYSWSYSYS